MAMKLRFRLWHMFALVAVVAVVVWVLQSDYVLVYTSDHGWRYGPWDDVLVR